MVQPSEHPGTCLRESLFPRLHLASRLREENMSPTCPSRQFLDLSSWIVALLENGVPHPPERHSRTATSPTPSGRSQRFRAPVFAAALFALSACSGCPPPHPISPSTPAPSNLSYQTPPPLLVGVPIAPLTPTVTGAVTSYSVASALPSGLKLDTSSGAISGTPTVVMPAATYTITASNAAGSTSFGLSLSVDASPTVHLAVTAVGSSGETLTYQWRATDGALKNVSGPAADWVLPAGPGIHFAYVMVSNGNGGYMERRIAVNTDTIGTPAVVAAPITLTAPAAAPQQDDFYRSFVNWGSHIVNSHPHDVYAPNIAAYLQDKSSGARYPASGNVLTDLKGQAIIPGVPQGSNYVLNCSVDGGLTFSDCTSRPPTTTMLAAATTDYILLGGVSPPAFSGSFALQDGSPCGVVDEFFGVRVTATATLRDAQNNTLAGPVPINEFGDYSLPFNAKATSVLLKCENANPVTVNASGPDLGQAVLTGVSAPTISSMSATFNGTPVGTFLPPPSGLPSDVLTRADGYLGVKGADSRLDACQYYKTVGAVTSCDAAGELSGAISFEDWKRTVKIDRYAVPGVPEYTATYVNKMDLNLTRVHHSISYGPSQTAAYVCNHLGPPFSLVTVQGDIDAAIDNAMNAKNLVACVAMDYTMTPMVNGDQPFIRFLIFGPSGQLLPSVNLDGRAEKFVPGTCVVCHGGDHYAGKFPEDGSGFANVGGHFLPYDTGNFEFSSKTGLTEPDQEQGIYLLNQNVLNAGPTPAERELIAGWYASGQVLDKNYLPVSWQGQGPAAISFYQNVQARTCRSCHVAMIEGYNFDHYQNIAPGTQTSRFAYTSFDVGINVCGGSEQIQRDHMMPNSLVTFNRFWLTYQNTAGLPDQPTILANFFGPNTGATGTCTPGIIP